MLDPKHDRVVFELHGYCLSHLGYDEDAALKRHRVAKLAVRLPQVLDELRAGNMHLTGLFLLAKHLTEDNATELLAEARGKSRRQIEELIARRFPRPDAPASVEPLAVAGRWCHSKLSWRPAALGCSRHRTGRERRGASDGSGPDGGSLLWGR